MPPSWSSSCSTVWILKCNLQGLKPQEHESNPDSILSEASVCPYNKMCQNIYINSHCYVSSLKSFTCKIPFKNCLVERSNHSLFSWLTKLLFNRKLKLLYETVWCGLTKRWSEQIIPLDGFIGSSFYIIYMHWSRLSHSLLLSLFYIWMCRIFVHCGVLTRNSTFYACSCINTHHKCLINRSAWAFLQNSGAVGRLISCQPTQMTSSEVTQHESCVDGDTWFMSSWVIGIIFHLSAQHYSNWWLPCVWGGCTSSLCKETDQLSTSPLTILLLHFILQIHSFEWFTL